MSHTKFSHSVILSVCQDCAIVYLRGDQQEEKRQISKRMLCATGKDKGWAN